MAWITVPVAIAMVMHLICSVEDNIKTQPEIVFGQCWFLCALLFVCRIVAADAGIYVYCVYCVYCWIAWHSQYALHHNVIFLRCRKIQFYLLLFYIQTIVLLSSWARTLSFICMLLCISLLFFGACIYMYGIAYARWDWIQFPYLSMKMSSNDVKQKQASNRESCFIFSISVFLTVFLQFLLNVCVCVHHRNSFIL